MNWTGKGGNIDIIQYVFWRNNVMHYDPVEEADWWDGVFSFIWKSICTQVKLNYKNNLNCSLCETFIKEPCRAIFYLFKKIWYSSSYQLNSKNNVQFCCLRVHLPSETVFHVVWCYWWQELTWIWSRIVLYNSTGAFCRASTFFYIYGTRSYFRILAGPF